MVKKTTCRKFISHCNVKPPSPLMQMVAEVGLRVSPAAVEVVDMV